MFKMHILHSLSVNLQQYLIQKNNFDNLLKNVDFLLESRTMYAIHDFWISSAR